MPKKKKTITRKTAAKKKRKKTTKKATKKKKARGCRPKKVVINLPVEVFVTDKGKVEVYVDHETNAERILNDRQRLSIAQKLLDGWPAPDVVARHIVWIEAEVPVPEVEQLKVVKASKSSTYARRGLLED